MVQYAGAPQPVGFFVATDCDISVVPAQAGTHTSSQRWIPACAGMTDRKTRAGEMVRSEFSLEAGGFEKAAPSMEATRERSSERP